MQGDVPIVQASDVCVITASVAQGVAPDLMLAVRSVERGQPGKSVSNTDGTVDFNEPGLNTRTVRDLANQGWDAGRMLNDGCYAMNAAAFWMRSKLLDVRMANTPLLARAARYNSKTPQYNIAYQQRLQSPLRTWACHLHHFWSTPADQLFAVASEVMSEKELNTCKPQQNPY